MKEQQGHMNLCVTEQLLHVLTSNMTGIPQAFFFVD